MFDIQKQIKFGTTNSLNTYFKAYENLNLKYILSEFTNYDVKIDITKFQQNTIENKDFYLKTFNLYSEQH